MLRKLDFAPYKKDEFLRAKEDRNFSMLTHSQSWNLAVKELKEKDIKNQDAESLKRKWTNIFSDYKKINDYQKRSGAACWWGMTPAERKKTNVKLVMPNYEEDLYNLMNSFFSQKHNVNPPIILDYGKLLEARTAKEDEFSTSRVSKSSNKKKDPADEEEEKPDVSLPSVSVIYLLNGSQLNSVIYRLTGSQMNDCEKI